MFIRGLLSFSVATTYDHRLTPYYNIETPNVKYVVWCVVVCRSVWGGLGVKKAFSFNYITPLGQCQVFSGNFAR